MKIAVVGGYGVGLTMRVTDAPEAGQTVTGGLLCSGHGGKGSNQAIACSRLGAQVSLFTAVGDDPAGHDARRMWAEEGIDASRVVTLAAPTMTGFIVVDSTGENRICIAPGALDLASAESVEAFRPQIADADLLLVSLEISLPAALAALSIARECGTRTLLNPAPARALPSAVLGMADILTPNLSEARLLAPSSTGSPEDLARSLATRGPGAVVVTLGSDGAHVATGSASYRVAAVPASRVIDTAGAGDAFTAALGVAIGEGSDLAGAVRYAAGAGAYAVGFEEVVPSLPTRAQLDRFLRQPVAVGGRHA